MTWLNHLVSGRHGQVGAEDHREKRREKSFLIWIKGTPLNCRKIMS
jgi:hypothetical protein